jgi:microcystin-dependent protein
MPGPEFILRSYEGGAFPCQLSAPMSDVDLAFTLSGPFVNWPTGAEGPGPFTLAMDDGLPTVEKILCATLDISTGVATVYTSGSFTGRGYDGTSANAHTPQPAPNPQVRPCWTAEEAMEANIAVNVLMGEVGTQPNGYVLTAEAGAPTWQAPGGSAGGLVPIGAVSMYAGSAAPTGYHICDGTAVSRTGFAALFTAIGTTWGVGDGSTTFNLPDLRDRFPMGAHTTLALAATGGSLAIPFGALPAHTHPVNITDPTHYHAAQPGFDVVVQTASTDNLETGGSGTPVASNVGNPNTDSKATGITATTSSTGAGGDYLQPAAGINFIIRTN